MKTFLYMALTGSERKPTAHSLLLIDANSILEAS